MVEYEKLKVNANKIIPKQEALKLKLTLQHCISGVSQRHKQHNKVTHTQIVFRWVRCDLAIMI